MGENQEELFEPALIYAWKNWKKQFSWWWGAWWVVILIILGVGYWLIVKSDWRFVLVSLASIVVILSLKLPYLVNKMIKIDKNNKMNWVLWLMWMMIIVAIKRVGWWAENVDNGTALFLLYLPAVWLFQIPRVVNGFLALAIIPFLPFFLAFGMDRTAEIWAVILYFLLVVSTIQMVREVKSEET